MSVSSSRCSVVFGCGMRISGFHNSLVWGTDTNGDAWAWLLDETEKAECGARSGAGNTWAHASPFPFLSTLVFVDLITLARSRIYASAVAYAWRNALREGVRERPEDKKLVFTSCQVRFAETNIMLMEARQQKACRFSYQDLTNSGFLQKFCCLWTITNGAEASSLLRARSLAEKRIRY